MAIKKLQNDFTTPEQSKRLLELGVPADSADCAYDCSLIGGEKYYSLSILEDELFSTYKRLWEDPCTDIIPCWSVGRLVEICLKCSTLKQRQVRFFCNGDDDEYSLIDYAITALVSGVMTNHMDFSKLEE